MSSQQPAGSKPRMVQSIKCNIGEKAYKGGAGGRHKGQAVKRTVIARAADAAGSGGGTKDVNHQRSE